MGKELEFESASGTIYEEAFIEIVEIRLKPREKYAEIVFAVFEDAGKMFVNGAGPVSGGLISVFVTDPAIYDQYLANPGNTLAKILSNSFFAAAASGESRPPTSGFIIHSSLITGEVEITATATPAMEYAPSYTAQVEVTGICNGTVETP